MASVSSNMNPYVIPLTMSDPNPSQTAYNKSVERNLFQHQLVNVSRSGGSKKSRGKKGKKSKYASSSRRKFSRKFRKSLRRSSRSHKIIMKRRNKNKKLSRGGAAAATMTIPSFSQTTRNGTSIINQLASNHAQTLAYSSFDSDVKIAPTAEAAVPSK
jgi:hypothetical protein